MPASKRPFACNKPGVMSCSAIRYWLAELLDHHGWGSRVLARTLGRPDKNHGLRPKIDGRQWIYPVEQKRWSEVLKRIISGELICIPGKRGGVRKDGSNTGRAVVATDPKPLVGSTQMVWKDGKLRVQSRGFARPLPAWKMPEGRDGLIR